MVCLVRPEKSDPNRTRITIGRNRICYPGDVGTKTASLDLVTLVMNSILYWKDAKFVTFDISNLYLETPLDRPEYVRIKISDIPQDFVDKYNLLDFVRYGWIYFEINHGVYGLLQSVILANNLLEKLLSKHGYYQCATTLGLRCHKWHPILFSIIVDDFCVEYVGKRHAQHLCDALKEYYKIAENWKGCLYAGINLKWDYTQRTCRLTIDDYIANLCLKWNHPDPKKRQFSPFKHTPIIYGTNIQYDTEPPFSPALDDKGIFRIQSIVVALLHYYRAVYNKILVGINKLVQQQASATEDTDTALLQLLDYVATYPNDCILFRASGMVLAGHYDAAYLNVSKAQSRAGAHIMIYEDTPVPTSNGPVLTVAQIIKFVMSYASKS